MELVRLSSPANSREYADRPLLRSVSRYLAPKRKYQLQTWSFIFTGFGWFTRRTLTKASSQQTQDKEESVGPR